MAPYETDLQIPFSSSFLYGGRYCEKAGKINEAIFGPSRAIPPTLRTHAVPPTDQAPSWQQCEVHMAAWKKYNSWSCGVFYCSHVAF